ncbi:ribonuclease Y [Candidatus Roizmanbacteria bacterium RIFCSPHIGHO2_01_FULL_39_12b]|uniref:Ribonuclease Y n=1 Tax=Candidatus Roizmanbacteria bacterium RIFCSPHIGHO2_01_FULL_39_12b TaxID=1802030 RepID=A0A1F7G8K9_9BACT|nr:MAG: ribonuclease Y [Candidatus Roizmanbacteria bacterium RIFCSPHIGHO2_01_FULL_39_12b]OGK46070.1 MAG: ribonuclease Y [Candidatus Roizmanbacteria bacterium RIFCSPLOWO2_01_FULL_39_19]
MTGEVVELEKRINAKQAELDTAEKRTNEKQAQLEKELVAVREKREEILQKLEKVSGLSKDQAKDLILKGWEEKLKGEIARRIRESEEDIRAKAEEVAREILVDTMRFGAVDFTAEYTLSTIAIPNDEFKGRIIGKEGRNIRSFELATGVDVDLEEEGVIKLSSFDAVRREIARVSMERLIKDGRIQPPRIEEIVKKTGEDIEKVMQKAGEDLCHSVGVYSLPIDLIKMLGRFKYRYSYGQNMILHTLEETKIGIAIANEVGADVMTVKLGCLLHDIGKIVADKEGSHIQLGVDLLQKHKLPQKVIDAVASHHEDVPFSSVEAVIVYIADAMSGGRPGARHEDFEEYLKRIKTIEAAAKLQKGVAEVYALQAGRELRVIVRPEEVTEDEMTIMGANIRAEIEEKFPTFPGQVKITIIREVRTVATSHS